MFLIANVMRMETCILVCMGVCFWQTSVHLLTRKRQLGVMVFSEHFSEWVQRQHWLQMWKLGSEGQAGSRNRTWRWVGGVF